MTPSLANGERREFTELDVAGLADVGWEIVPEPNAAFLLTIGCVFLLLRRGPRRGA